MKKIELLTFEELEDNQYLSFDLNSTLINKFKNKPSAESILLDLSDDFIELDALEDSSIKTHRSFLYKILNRDNQYVVLSKILTNDVPYDLGQILSLDNIKNTFTDLNLSAFEETFENKVIQLISPNIENENHFLFFELEDKSRFTFKNDIDFGVAGSLYLSISNCYFSISVSSESVRYYTNDIHKIFGLGFEDKFLMISYSHYSDDVYNSAKIISKKYIYDNFDKEDISSFERTF